MYWFKSRFHANNAGALYRVLITVKKVVKKLAKTGPKQMPVVAERRWRMKQFGWQVVACSMPVMQWQERHGHQELIAALTGQQASWWYMSRGGNDLPQININN